MSGKGQRQAELNKNDHARLTINYLDRMELIEATHSHTQRQQDSDFVFFLLQDQINNKQATA